MGMSTASSREAVGRLSTGAGRPAFPGWIMLTAVVTDINTVDEAVRGFYKEADGKFVLQVTPAEGFKLENVDGLVSALGAERNLKKGLEDKAKLFEGIDPTLARQAIARVAEYGDLTPEQAKAAKETAERLSALDPKKDAERIAEEKVNTVTGQLKQQFALRETELTGQVEAQTKVNDSLKAQLKNLMVDNTIKAGLAPLNPLDDARDAIELLAGQQIVTEEKDGKFLVHVKDPLTGAPRIKDSAGTPFTVADLLAEIREKRPSLFKADNVAGIGTNPGGNPPKNTGQANPWKKETFNRTQQAILTNTKPELAKQLKAQAGVA
jgi:hypothetical protein